MYTILCLVVESQGNLWRARHAIGWILVEVLIFIVFCLELTAREYLFPSWQGIRIEASFLRTESTSDVDRWSED